MMANSMKVSLANYSMSGKYSLWRVPKGLIPRLTGRGYSLVEATRIMHEQGLLTLVKRQGNLIVDVGRNLTQLLLIDNGNTGLSWFAIGTGTNPPTVADVQLQAETFRQPFSSRSVAGAVASFTTFILAADCSIIIEEIGIFGDTASITPNSGALFSRTTFHYDNSVSMADLLFEYDLTFL